MRERHVQRERKRCCSRVREREREREREKERAREREESTDSEISNGLFVWFGGGIFFLLSAAEAAKEAERARNESEQHKAAFYQKLGLGSERRSFRAREEFLAINSFANDLQIWVQI